MPEKVEALPLARKRRVLGLLIPAVNLPLFAYNLYFTIQHLGEGLPAFISDHLVEDAVVLGSTLFLTLAIPRFFPVYASTYTLTEDALELRRFLRPVKRIPLREVDRVELYLRSDEEVSREASEYASNQAANLRRSGFKFRDYTNDEQAILNIFHGQEIYMVSPARPKAFLKELKRRNKRLSARVVELTRRGKRVRDLQ